MCGLRDNRQILRNNLEQPLNNALIFLIISCNELENNISFKSVVTAADQY